MVGSARYLMKPIDLTRVLEAIGQLLKVQLKHAGSLAPPAVRTLRHVTKSDRRPPVHHVKGLMSLGQIGHIRGIQSKLDELSSE